MSKCTGCGFTEGHHRPDCAKVARHPKNNHADMAQAPEVGAAELKTHAEHMVDIESRFGPTRASITDDQRKLGEETLDRNPILQQLLAERVAKAVENIQLQDPDPVSELSLGDQEQRLRSDRYPIINDPALDRIAAALERYAAASEKMADSFVEQHTRRAEAEEPPGMIAVYMTRRDWRKVYDRVLGVDEINWSTGNPRVLAIWQAAK